MPHVHKDSLNPGSLEETGVPSAGGTGASQSVPGKVRAKVRQRDYTGWMLSSTEAAKLATAYGPFKHTFCGPSRSEGEPLLAAELPF